MMDSPFIYFTDAVLRGPTLGTMLMCLAAAWVGVIVFLRKQSLLGESLSHAAYPGVICGVIIAGISGIDSDQESLIAVLIIFGAVCTSLLGLWMIQHLEQRLKVRSDSALCFVLSAFFGIGITLASEVQFSHTNLYRQVQTYLYGQAATMSDLHILIYGILCGLVLLTIVAYYKEIQVILFDREYAQSLGINAKPIDGLIFLLIVLAVVIGIRSVGVVLMSAMLISPAVAARQFTNRLSYMFVLAGFFGLLCAFLGNYFSVEGGKILSKVYPDVRMTLPTGPMIVSVASLLCLISLMIAPKRGLLWRLIRIARFRHRCLCENILKSFWRHGPHKEIFLSDLLHYQSIGSLHMRFILLQLSYNGWITSLSDGSYRLTNEGQIWAAKIVRLHRLWEVYLSDYLGVGAEKVHRNAEEMEHIITPQLERELTLLLQDPKRDPHHQPIPPLVQ